jgi:glucose-1-phosphate thymidylyltransferase
VFVINETKHQLIGYFGDGQRFGCHLSYVAQERLEPSKGKSRGLAQALDAGYHLTRGKWVAFGMADTIITPVNVFEILLQPQHRGADVILGLFETANPEKFGMVELDSGGTVQRIVDKPAQTDLRMMWGCIVWQSRFTEFLHTCIDREDPTDFAAIMNAAIERGFHFKGVEIPAGSYIDVGTYDEITRLEQEYRG